MKLKKLYYRNNLTGWNVEEVSFDSLTILVGASGVGKTQILYALSSLARFAQIGLCMERIFAHGSHRFSRISTGGGVSCPPLNLWPTYLAPLEFYFTQRVRE